MRQPVSQPAGQASPRRPGPEKRGRPARTVLGRDGEAAAARHLQARGFHIAARNLRIARTEIDLVARRGRLVVFCEVKTRSGDGMGAPEEAVVPRKRARIVRAAEAYLDRHPNVADVRFDVISIVSSPGRLRVRHIEDAFRPW